MFTAVRNNVPTQLDASESDPLAPKHFCSICKEKSHVPESCPTNRLVGNNAGANDQRDAREDAAKAGQAASLELFQARVLRGCRWSLTARKQRPLFVSAFLSKLGYPCPCQSPSISQKEKIPTGIISSVQNVRYHVGDKLRAWDLCSKGKAVNFIDVRLSPISQSCNDISSLKTKYSELTPIRGT
jgi:hypothetical protein